MFQIEQAIIRPDFTPACSLNFFHFTVLVIPWQWLVQAKTCSLFYLKLWVVYDCLEKIYTCEYKTNTTPILDAPLLNLHDLHLCRASITRGMSAKLDLLHGFHYAVHIKIALQWHTTTLCVTWKQQLKCLLHLSSINLRP